MTQDCDVLIVGAGPIGACLAAALASLPLRVTLVDPRPLDAAGPPRSLALTLGSQRILSGIGAWPALAAGAAPIREVHVSERGRLGMVRLRAQDLALPALGYLITEPALRQAALAVAPRQLDLRVPARLRALTQDADGVTATLQDAVGATQVRTRLLVAADGTESSACALADMPLLERDTGRAALVGRLHTGKAHGGVAYERFTDTGPLALLPGTEPHSRHLIWTLPAQRAQALAGLPTHHLLALLEQRFGSRAGPLTELSAPAHFPLRETRREAVRGRVLAIGNAAHTLHPVAAQGFNLGLRDVAQLAELLAVAARSGADTGAPALLARYVAQRRGDWQQARTFTRLLPALFEETGLPLAAVRTLGLLALHTLAPLRQRFASAAMGLHGARSALERGLPL